VLVASVRGSWFRCYERVEVGFGVGLIGIVGPNGAGKTSLVEMIHFGALAYSPRTTTEAQVVSFGQDVTRVEVAAQLATGPSRVEVGFRPGEPKRVVVDGVAERSAAGLLARFPVLALLRDYWPDVLRVIVCALIATVSTMTAVFALGYATSKFGVARPTMLWAGVLGNATALITQPLWALLADKIGRKPVFIGGVLGCAVLVFPYFMALTTGNTLAIFAAAMILSGIIYAAPNAIWPSFYAEMFEARVRYSGTAIGTQLGFLAAGFTPVISQSLVGEGPTGWIPVAIFVACCCVISAAAAATARETLTVDMADLGKRRS